MPSSLDNHACAMYADRINDNEERISQSSRNSDTGPPPSYQSHHYTPPANQGRREHIWIDIEKGRESNTHTHSAFSLQSNRYLPEPSSREYPTSITELSRLGHTDQSYSHRTLSTQLPLSQSHFTYIQATSTPSSLASITSFATLAEAKRSLTIHLYKSIPIRLLAYVILLFNALLVIKVMAEPMSSLAMNGGNMYEETGQIRLGGSALEQRIPCVAATSHNDEMQAAPFSEAMSLGITSIESDTWLVDGVMLAGHELEDCSKGKTFKGVYLDPLYKMLERANVNSERLRIWDSEDWKGVFPLDPKQELMLMIDIKNDPEGSYNHSLELLQPFIEKNYLTVYRDGKLVPGPLTIVGTGDTPIPLVLAASPRYIFYDAPLIQIQHPITAPDGSLIEWGPEIAPIASSKWLWWNYYPNLNALKTFSDNAHAKGIKARWWGVARWPGYFRRALWDLQLRAEVDIINADDLADVAAFLRKKETERRQLSEQANRSETSG